VLEKMATYIRDNGIDVCFVQEVNGTQTTNVFEAQLEGYEIAYHQTDTSLLWGNIGIAIISKYDIVDTDFVAIPKTNGSEARGLLKAMLDVNHDGKADVATICTHFDGTSEDDSATGVTLLKTMVKGIADATPNMPVIFGGDLNQAYNGDTNTIHIKEIGKFLSSTTYGLTSMKTFYNETFPEGLQLDYIFKNSVVGQGEVKVANPTMTGDITLSDHRPLVATLYVMAQ
jgi:endonuclease/exonuclease/phosphatase family metal-dependent hydrolase